MAMLFPGYKVGSKRWGDAGNAQSDITVSTDNYVLANIELKKGLLALVLMPISKILGTSSNFKSIINSNVPQCF